MLGCNGNVFEASTMNYSFVPTEIQLNASSSSTNHYDHTHDFDMIVKCYDISYSKSMIIFESYINYDYNIKSLKSVRTPDMYSYDGYTGRYFKGEQKCVITIWGVSKTYTKEF